MKFIPSVNEHNPQRRPCQKIVTTVCLFVRTVTVNVGFVNNWTTIANHHIG